MLDQHVQALQAADQQVKNAVSAVNGRVTAILAKLNTAIDQDDEDAIDGVSADLTSLKTQLDAIAPAAPTDVSGDTDAGADGPAPGTDPQTGSATVAGQVSAIQSGAA